MRKVIAIICTLFTGVAVLIPYSVYGNTYGYIPFYKINLDQLNTHERNKKVFAHYFTAFPVSVANEPEAEDYYTVNYLSPEGEGYKFWDRGGYLRQRPLVRAPFINGKDDYRLKDLHAEARLASSIGIDGFAVNILGYGDDNIHWVATKRLLTVANKVRNFSILLMPDMNANLKNNPDNLVPMVEELSTYPAAYRLDDGRLLIAPYLAENFEPSWWADKLDELDRKGIRVAFMPVYQGWGEELERFKSEEPAAYLKYVYGVSDWGPRTPTSGSLLIEEPIRAQAEFDVKWMAPTAPQDVRPKSRTYMESANTEAYRNMWLSAINGDADYVHIITWNDYSESSEIRPSNQTGYSFFDLSAYYIHWFKTGEQPRIQQDAIYAFYREQSIETPLTYNIQRYTIKLTSGEPARDYIEMIAFLTSPARLEVFIGGNYYKTDVYSSGMHVFKVPVSDGIPIFRIVRNGDLSVQHIGRWTINSTPNDIQDIMYRGSNSLRFDQNYVGTNLRKISEPYLENFDSKHSIRPSGYYSPMQRTSNNLPEVLRFIPEPATNGEPRGGILYDFLPIEGSSKALLKLQIDVLVNSLCIGSADMNFVMRNTSDENILELAMCNQQDDSHEQYLINNSTSELSHLKLSDIEELMKSVYAINYESFESIMRSLDSTNEPLRDSMINLFAAYKNTASSNEKSLIYSQLEERFGWFTEEQLNDIYSAFSMTLSEWQWYRYNIIVWPSSTSGEYNRYDLWQTSTTGVQKFRGGLSLKQNSEDISSFGFELVDANNYSSTNYVEVYLSDIRFNY